MSYPEITDGCGHDMVTGHAAWQALLLLITKQISANVFKYDVNRREFETITVAVTKLHSPAIGAIEDNLEVFRSHFPR